MSGPASYGNPCRECAYFWPADLSVARGIVAATPARYATLLAGTDGRQRHASLNWTATGYVVHVADNLRGWAERLAGTALGGSKNVAGYDHEAVAGARAYARWSIPAALWTLRRAVGDWQDAVDLGVAGNVVLEDAVRGRLSVADVVSGNAHDAFHHGWDIERSAPRD